MAKRRRTHLTLEDLTLGYLRYLKQENVIDTNYEIIDIVLDAFMENYAEENGLDINDIRAESLELQKQSLRPQSSRSKADNKKAALKSMAKLKMGEKGTKKNILDEISDDSWLSNFKGEENE